jgi:FkbM family methyltransferase
MNLSGISNRTLLGRLIRSPLRLIPRSAIVPILQGPLRGKKWIAGSSTHGCWIGSFEHEKQMVFRRVVSRGNVVCDLGANVGFYSLLASVLVGDAGHVYSFEPLPANAAILHRHLEMNRIFNCTVLQAAVTADDGVARFDPSSSGDLAHLSETGAEIVSTVALDSLLATGKIRAPQVMKIDVEGAELHVLRGATRLIEAHRPVILLATHGAEVHRGCLNFLRDRAYALESLTADQVENSSEILARPD